MVKDLLVTNDPYRSLAIISKAMFLIQKHKVNGLPSPLKQLKSIKKEFVKAVLDRDEKGNSIRKSGIMAIVLKGGSCHGCSTTPKATFKAST